jgi:tetratricopeptide (TPR) repeat protein
MTDPNRSIIKIYRMAQRLQGKGDLVTARAHLLEVLQLQPEHADALHSLGNIDAKEGRLDDAERLVRKAIAIDPLKAAFLNSLGNLLRARGKPDEATAAYEQAVALRPDLAAGHNNLAELQLRKGRYEAAIDRCFQALKADPNYAGAYDTMGRALNNIGRLEEAADAFRRAVIIRDDFAVAYDHLGHVQRAQGKMDEAREAFEHALMIDPENASARYNLGTVLIVLGELDRGMDCLEQAREIRPRHVPTLLNLAIAYHTKGRLKLAADTYREATEVDPENPTLHLNLGLVHVEQRLSDEAERSFLKALELDPAMVQVYAELAALYEETNRLAEMQEMLNRGLALEPDHARLNLEAAKADRRQGRIEEGIARLRRLDPTSLDTRLAEQVRYQMGYLLDRAGAANEAFENFCEANRLASETVRARDARPQRFLDMLDRLNSFFSTADIHAWKPAPQGDGESPVFMVGFPRSGTTLLDVALDSHPNIATVEEQHTIMAVIDVLRQGEFGFPDQLAALTVQDIAGLRSTYLEALAGFVPAEFDGLVIDKMPIRTVHAGILWRLFPDAKFLFCARHPCDVVLSNFMQHFNVSDLLANFYTLEGSARLYDKVMSLWHTYTSRLPLRQHTIRYEALVEDMESEMRQVLEFLGLPWDPAVLDYPGRAIERGRINTNSYHQVTEPVYARSSGRWRAYRAQLEPYMGLLSPHIERFGYEC